MPKNLMPQLLLYVLPNPYLKDIHGCWAANVPNFVVQLLQPAINTQLPLRNFHTSSKHHKMVSRRLMAPSLTKTNKPTESKLKTSLQPLPSKSDRPMPNIELQLPTSLGLASAVAKATFQHHYHHI